MDLGARSHELYRRAVWLTALLPMAVFLLGLSPSYRTWRLAAWGACYAASLTLMLFGSGRDRRVVPVAAMQCAMALLATAILATSAEGALLVSVVAQLASRLRLRTVVFVAVAQTLAFGILLGRQRPLEIAVDVALAWLGFQVFAILLTHVARSEAEGRTELAQRNIELLATRHLLAERTRQSERLRMARDLHDGLGHHLTALSLNLEAASHLATGDAREHLGRAQKVTRALLSDVRTVVSGVREAELDVMQAIRELVEPIEAPRVHVLGPESLAGSDPSHGETLLRLVQEIVTNALRHAQARNLWISVRPSEQDTHVEGRDDGRGAAVWQEGNGLRGMRERLAALGGSLEVSSSPGSGFLLHARIPASGGPQ